jgi:hypothetical protein
MLPTLPDHLANRPRSGALDDIGAGLGASTPPYVSIKGNRFTLVDAVGNKIPVQTFDPQIGGYIDVVLVAGNRHTSQVYYEAEFNPAAAEFQPPDCWSDNGVAPSVNAMKPQHVTCDGCPKAEWGSDVSKATGRGIPACGQYKKLAVIFSDPDVAGDMVFLLRVPPNSIKPLRSYVQQIAKMQVQGRQLDTTDLITRVYFDVGPNGNQLGTLGFKAIDFVDSETLEVVDKVVAETASLDLLLGRNDRPRTGALPAPAPAAAQASIGQVIGATMVGPTAGRATAWRNAQNEMASFAAAQATQAVDKSGPAPGFFPAAQPAAPVKGKRGRPKAASAAQASPSVQPSPRPAPFAPQVVQNAPAPAPEPPAAAPTPAQGGIVAAPAPDAALTAQLNALFGR